MNLENNIHLPDEILCHIFQFIELGELETIMKTNFHLKNLICYNDKIWQIQCNKIRDKSYWDKYYKLKTNWKDLFYTEQQKIKEERTGYVIKAGDLKKGDYVVI